MKLSGDLPRVHRSPIPERNRVYLMPGDQFEDGQWRIIVGMQVSDEHLAELEALMDTPDAAEIGERLEHMQRVQRAVSAINAILRRNHDERGAS